MGALTTKLRGIFNKQEELPDAVTCFFEHEVIICHSCHQVMPIEGLEPLSFMQCPSCSLYNYVPAQIGPFMLFLPVGAGGNAKVFRACTQDEPGQVYAVKILWKDEEEAIDDFAAEARVHYAVTEHPNIVDFVEFGEDGGNYYCAMELVERASSIQKLVEERNGLDEYQTFYAATQLVSALRHIYGCGYLYRDLNDTNVLLTEEQKAYVIDFGLTMSIEDAAIDRSQITQGIDGTPLFLPPERIHRTGEDERSVVYSLGMLMYYMLKGETLIKSESPIGCVRRHLSPLRLAINGGTLTHCSEECVNIISAAVRPEVEERFQTLEEMESYIIGHLEALAREVASQQQVATQVLAGR